MLNRNMMNDDFYSLIHGLYERLDARSGIIADCVNPEGKVRDIFREFILDRDMEPDTRRELHTAVLRWPDREVLEEAKLNSVIDKWEKHDCGIVSATNRDMESGNEEDDIARTDSKRHNNVKRAAFRRLQKDVNSIKGLSYIKMEGRYMEKREIRDENNEVIGTI